MAEGRLRLPFVLGIDFGAVLMSRLRQIEIVAGRVVRAVAGERPVARPLHDLDVGILLRDLGTDLFEVLDLDPEMVEARLAAAAAGGQRHAEIAIADRNRADLARRIARGLQTERRAVEHAEQRVVIARDGKVVELPEHAGLLAIPGFTDSSDRARSGESRRGPPCRARSWPARPSRAPLRRRHGWPRG